MGLEPGQGAACLFCPGSDREAVEREGCGYGKERDFMKKRKRTAFLFGAALMLGIWAAGCGKEEPPSDKPKDQTEETETEAGLKDGQETEKEEDGNEAKEKGPGLGTFEAKTLDGETFTQEDIAKKDVTLLNFWTTYCGPCIEEMPEIAEFAKGLPDHVQVVTVCLDAGSGEAQAKEILENAGFEGVTLVSGDGGLAEVVGGILYTPTTLVVDRDGNVTGDAIIGGQSDLEAVFTEAVNEALQAAGKEKIGNGES